MDCAVACIAFVLGGADAWNYYEAQRALDEANGDGDPCRRGYRCPQIVAALKALGHEYEEGEEIPRSADGPAIARTAPRLTMVYFSDRDEGRRGPYGGKGHFLVRWNDQWMCPIEGYVNEVDTRARPQWIIRPA